MSHPRGRATWREPIREPGDDVVPAPAQVTEVPPFDRFCDLVFTGGVASGVVYPWAIVELARAFRFKSIGGTSVGAMAAALAAAAEYGRRYGHTTAFEVLRRAPGSLGHVLPDGRTRMLSLFQPHPQGRRLMTLWARLGHGQPPQKSAQGADSATTGLGSLAWRAIGELLRLYRAEGIRGALAGAVQVKVLAWAWGLPLLSLSLRECLVMILAAVVLGCWDMAREIWLDFRTSVIQHNYGLCKGAQVEVPGDPGAPSGLTDWLHEGIQRSAGLNPEDPPLCFRDLWSAPAYPGARPQACGADDPPRQRAIDLQVITSNLTHGRPYRLPLGEGEGRLFYCPDEWKGYFPAAVLEALDKASKPYAPQKRQSPLDEHQRPYEPEADTALALSLRQLPGADLPIVVAARLSLSFPLLFAAVPLWAVDYEAPPGRRALRRCLFTDGGVSSNFPIHLFDAALPSRPTFGFWLDRHPPYDYGRENDVWLPKYALQGRGDNWDRFDPGSRPTQPMPEGQPTPGDPDDDACGAWVPPAQADAFGGFLRSILNTATAWRDRTSFRMPHVRNRVIRLMLRAGEGGLNIGMPREQILRMAHRYGTKAGQVFVQRYAPQAGQPARAWQEQRWIRLNLLVNGLRERLDGLATVVRWPAHTLPLARAFASARSGPGDPVTDQGRAFRVRPEQVDALADLVTELENLERSLRSAAPAYKSDTEPELRLRPPL